MKFSLTIILLLLFSTLTIGQEESNTGNSEWSQKGDIQIGILTGFSVNVFQEPSIDFPNFSSGLGYLAGVQADYFLHRNWSLKTRINYERRYYTSYSEDNYIAPQLLASWHFGAAKKWYMHLGPAYSYSLKDNLSNSLGGDFGIGLQFPIEKAKFFFEYDVLVESTTSNFTYVDFNGNPAGDTSEGGYRFSLKLGISF